MAESSFKEARHKLTIAKCIICNGDIIVESQTFRNQMLKSVHEDVHCSEIVS